MLKPVVIHEAEQHEKDDAESFIKATHVTDPVEYAVDVSIDPIQIQVEFISDLLLHIIRKLVRPILLQLIRKDASIVLRHMPELIVIVLQS